MNAGLASPAVPVRATLTGTRVTANGSLGKDRPTQDYGSQGEGRGRPPRPKPWAETGRQGRTRYVWRFDGQKYRALVL